MPKPVEKAEGVPECEVLHGDCLEVLKGYPDEYFSACITDPPYGLSKEPDVAEVMHHWLAGDAYEHGSNGFMGRSWDSFVPGPEYWREVYRTMRPGAHLLAFAGTRTWDLLSMAIRLAGFENRDTIRHHQGVPSLAWVFGSGFAKGANISKHIDKVAGVEREVVGPKIFPDGKGRNNDAGIKGNRYGAGIKSDGGPKVETAPATDAAKRWEGWHTSLKPAWEIILVFRKPLSASSVARQVLQNGCGALNVDASRIGNGADIPAFQRFGAKQGIVPGAQNPSKRTGESTNQGRFPSNFLLSHVPGPNGCQRVGTKRVPNRNGQTNTEPSSTNTYGWAKGGIYKKGASHAGPDGMEEVESWSCARDEAGNYICPVALLDEQSAAVGVHGAGRARQKIVESEYAATSYDMSGKRPMNRFGDSGGASRFFAQFPGEPDAYCQEPPESDNSDVLSSQNDDSVVFEPDTGPGFFYCAKSSKAERNKGLEGVPEKEKKTLGNYRNPSEGRTASKSGAPMSNSHPTVKPLKLCDYLCELICPPGGTILDPFMGSGSTGCSAVRKGFNFVGIEREAEYVAIARKRIEHWASQGQPEENRQERLPL